MAFFQYRAADQAGKVVEGVMEADAEQGVILRLREMGCVPLRIAVPSDRAVSTARQQALFTKRRVIRRTSQAHQRCKYPQQKRERLKSLHQADGPWDNPEGSRRTRDRA